MSIWLYFLTHRIISSQKTCVHEANERLFFLCMLGLRDFRSWQFFHNYILICFWKNFLKLTKELFQICISVLLLISYPSFSCILNFLFSYFLSSLLHNSCITINTTSIASAPFWDIFALSWDISTRWIFISFWYGALRFN